jgi:hypothetical protein
LWIHDVAEFDLPAAETLDERKGLEGFKATPCVLVRNLQHFSQQTGVEPPQYGCSIERGTKWFTFRFRAGQQQKLGSCGCLGVSIALGFFETLKEGLSEVHR